MANVNGRSMWAVMSRRIGEQEWKLVRTIRGVHRAQKYARLLREWDRNEQLYTVEAHAIPVERVPTWTGPEVVTLAECAVVPSRKS